MAKRTGGLSISYAVDSASEDEAATANNVLLPASNTENLGGSVPRQGKLKTADNAKAVAANAKPKVTSNKPVTQTNKPTVGPRMSKSARTALADISNTPAASETEEPDEFENLPENNEMTGVRRKKAAPSDTLADPMSRGGKQRKSRSKKNSAAEQGHIPETQEDEVTIQSKLSRTKPAGSKKPKPVEQKEIPETQLDAIEQGPSGPNNERENDNKEIDQPENTISTKGGAQDRAPPHRLMQDESSTVQTHNEAALRRKLNDMTKKVEALDLKYRELRNVGIKESDDNFESLKKASDEKARAADDLIASLRTDLDRKTTIAEESSALRDRLQNLTNENEELEKENSKLQSSVNDLQNEVKALQAKLAASRSHPVPIQNGVDSTKLPVVAQQNINSTKASTTGGVDAVKDVLKRALKEDLYCDLTGLILRDVKRREEDGEDIFDCIQTGRNGTLHFHLTVANPSASASSKGASTAAPVHYEEAEFQYTPLLDDNRDRDLVNILPDYLTEEICFPRNQAAKFYSRIVDCLTKKLDIADGS